MVTGESSSVPSPRPPAIDVSQSVTEAEEEMSWNQLWSEFVQAAPQLDLQEWTTLLDEIDGTLGTERLGSLVGL